MDLSEARQVDPSEGEWYDNARYALVKKLLTPTLRRAKLTVDLGCGTGRIALRVKEDFATQVHAHDPFLSDDDVLRLGQRGVEAHAVFPSHLRGEADVTLLMDVLEHVDAPAVLLEQAFSLMNSHGCLLVTVPAYRWLWSSHDVALGHRDRYTRARLKELLATRLPAGARVSSGYAFPALLAGAAPVRLAERLRKPRRGSSSVVDSQLQRLSPRATALLERVGTAEARIVGAQSPVGLTCVAIVRSPERQP